MPIASEDLDGDWLTELASGYNDGMDPESAAAVAKRVMLHLYRGSIDLAHDALNDGWFTWINEHKELPTGTELLEEPIGRVLEDLRIVNMLEKYGVLTVEQFLSSEMAAFEGLPYMGPATMASLRNLRASLRLRCG